MSLIPPPVGYNSTTSIAMDENYLMAVYQQYDRCFMSFTRIGENPTDTDFIPLESVRGCNFRLSIWNDIALASASMIYPKVVTSAVVFQKIEGEWEIHSTLREPDTNEFGTLVHVGEGFFMIGYLVPSPDMKNAYIPGVKYYQLIDNVWTEVGNDIVSGNFFLLRNILTKTLWINSQNVVEIYETKDKGRTWNLVNSVTPIRSRFSFNSHTQISMDGQVLLFKTNYGWWIAKKIDGKYEIILQMDNLKNNNIRQSRLSNLDVISAASNLNFPYEERIQVWQPTIAK